MRKQQALRKLTNTGNIARKEESNKQEQIRETVLDYMWPLSQPSVSMSTLCFRMRHNHKRDVDKLLRPPSAMRWVKASGKLLGLTDGDVGGNFAGALLW